MFLQAHLWPEHTESKDMRQPKLQGLLRELRNRG